MSVQPSVRPSFRPAPCPSACLRVMIIRNFQVSLIILGTITYRCCFQSVHNPMLLLVKCRQWFVFGFLVYRCYGRTTFEGPSIYTTCLENGQWSHPVPKCWSKLKCQGFQDCVRYSKWFRGHFKHFVVILMGRGTAYDLCMCVSSFPSFFWLYLRPSVRPSAACPPSSSSDSLSSVLMS